MTSSSSYSNCPNKKGFGVSTRTVKVPQIILDTCPLPDGYIFRAESWDRWASLFYKPDEDAVWWISSFGEVFTLQNWTEDRVIKITMPIETTNEELWRYVYAQFILGDTDA
jgi:hypothetical protein